MADDERLTEGAWKRAWRDTHLWSVRGLVAVVWLAVTTGAGSTYAARLYDGDSTAVAVLVQIAGTLLGIAIGLVVALAVRLSLTLRTQRNEARVAHTEGERQLEQAHAEHERALASAKGRRLDETEAREFSRRVAKGIVQFLDECEAEKPQGAVMSLRSKEQDWADARNRFVEEQARYADRTVDRAKDKFGEQMREAYEALDAHGLADNLDRYRLEHPTNIADLRDIAEQLRSAATSPARSRSQPQQSREEQPHSSTLAALKLVRGELEALRELLDGRDQSSIMFDGLRFPMEQWERYRELLGGQPSVTSFDAISRAYRSVDHLKTEIEDTLTGRISAFGRDPDFDVSGTVEHIKAAEEAISRNTVAWWQP